MRLNTTHFLPDFPCDSETDFLYTPCPAQHVASFVLQLIKKQHKFRLENKHKTLFIVFNVLHKTLFLAFNILHIALNK